MEEVELKVHRAMIEFPEDSIEIKVTARIYSDGKLCDVSKTYNMSEIREMFRKADDGYIDEEDRFELTERGLEWLEEQKRLKNI